ncbi:MAG: transglutaminase family protein [bacterium]
MRKLKEKKLSPLFLLALLILLKNSSAAIVDIPVKEEWFIIYKNDLPIGYSHTSVEQMEAEDSAPVIEIDSEIWIKLSVGGTAVHSEMRSEERVAADNLRMVSARTEWKLGDAVSVVVARVEGEKITYTIKKNGGLAERELDYRHGCIPLSAVTLLLPELKIGDAVDRKLCVVQVRPDSVRLSALHIAGDAVKENFEMNGETIEVLRANMKLDGVPMVYRLGKDGTVYENLQPTLGFVQMRIDRAFVPKIEEIAGWDVLKTTATPSEAKISDQAHLRTITLMASWEAAEIQKAHLTGPGQTVEHFSRRRHNTTAKINLTKQEWSGGGTASDPPAPPKEAAIYLKETPCVNLNSALVREKTAEATEGAISQAEKAEKITSWIYRNIVPDPRAWSTVTTAEDALRLGIGMNKHYAVLFAAMSRTAGIPTKICGGKSYAFGMFVDHYWNEVLIGGQWLMVDATAGKMSPPPVSVKLAESASVSEVSSVLASPQGNIRIKIVATDYEKDKIK